MPSIALQSPFDLVSANECGSEWSPYTLPAGAHLVLSTSPSAAIQIHAGVAEAACESFRAAADGAGGALLAHAPVSAGVRSAGRPPPLARGACKTDTQSQAECTAIMTGQGEVTASREVGLLLQCREQASISANVQGNTHLRSHGPRTHILYFKSSK